MLTTTWERLEHFHCADNINVVFVEKPRAFVDLMIETLVVNKTKLLMSTFFIEPHLNWNTYHSL